jgi:hypothetical protein
MEESFPIRLEELEMWEERGGEGGLVSPGWAGGYVSFVGAVSVESLVVPAQSWNSPRMGRFW